MHCLFSKLKVKAISSQFSFYTCLIICCQRDNILVIDGITQPQDQFCTHVRRLYYNEP